MAKKVIVSESMAKKLVMEGIITEGNIDDILKNQEFNKKVKDIAKDAIKNDKELEKQVKKIVAKSVDTLFKVLWQRSAFYQSEIQK